MKLVLPRVLILICFPSAAALANMKKLYDANLKYSVQVVTLTFDFLPI